MRRLLGGLALIALAACRATRMPVQLQGDLLGMGNFAGEWSGEYWGAGNGRSGTITFSLGSAPDSAFGEVTMVDPSGRTPRAADPSDQHRLHVRAVQSLAIAFVRVSEGKVIGKMEPYVAPDCDCVVNTSFTGAVQGDSISGTFLTRTPQGEVDQGRWRVVRSGGTPR